MKLSGQIWMRSINLHASQNHYAEIRNVLFQPNPAWMIDVVDALVGVWSDAEATIEKGLKSGLQRYKV